MLTVEFSKIRGCEHAWLHNAVHSSHKPSYAIRARASLPSRSVLGGRLLQKTSRCLVQGRRPAREFAGLCSLQVRGKAVWLNKAMERTEKVHGRNTDEIL